jgi:hypothetical protein
MEYDRLYVYKGNVCMSYLYPLKYENGGDELKCMKLGMIEHCALKRI